MTTAPGAARVAAGAASLVLFGILATANSAGYRYGASDQAFYAPAIMRHLDPLLFPRDAPLLNVQADLTLADETIAAIARLTHLDLPPLFALLYVLTLVLLGLAVLWLGSAFYQSWWSAVALLAAISLRHAVPKTGTNTLEGYFHPRQLAFACGALAMAAFLTRRSAGRRYAAVIVLLSAAAALHPTTTLWFAIAMGAAFFAAEPRSRPVLAIGAAAAVPAVWWMTTYGPLAGRFQIMDPAWMAALADKDYLFPLGWPAHAWIVNLGYGVLIAAVWRARRASGTIGERETALVAGCAVLVFVFGVALVLQARGLALAVQLQPARVFWLLDFIATIYVVWLAAEGVRGGTRRRAATAAAVLLSLAAARGWYIMNVEFPDRPLAQVDVRDDDWGRVMGWARRTDRAAGWLADPAHAALHGTSVRVAGRRDVFVEAFKDAALGMYDRGVAFRTRDRVAALGDFGALDEAQARGLAARHGLDFLVTDAALNLPVEFEAGRLRVYRIGN